MCELHSSCSREVKTIYTIMNLRSPWKSWKACCIQFSLSTKPSYGNHQSIFPRFQGPNSQCLGWSTQKRQCRSKRQMSVLWPDGVELPLPCKAWMTLEACSRSSHSNGMDPCRKRRWTSARVTHLTHGHVWQKLFWKPSHVTAKPRIHQIFHDIDSTGCSWKRLCCAVIVLFLWRF